MNRHHQFKRFEIEMKFLHHSETKILSYNEVMTPVPNKIWK